MRKVEVGLRVAALQLNSWALFAHGRNKVAQRRLPIMVLFLLGLLIAILSLARVPAETTLGAPIRAGSVTAERENANGVAKNSVPVSVIKPDIVLPDIFIPVPAEIIVPARNQPHMPAIKNGTFKHSER